MILKYKNLIIHTKDINHYNFMGIYGLLGCIY